MKVVIFGAGLSGPRYAPKILEQGHEILCFVDNDTAKQGKTITLESAGGGQMLAYEIKPPQICLLYPYPSPRDISGARMPSSA